MWRIDPPDRGHGDRPEYGPVVWGSLAQAQQQQRRLIALGRGVAAGPASIIAARM
jgi:hypothetical protein